MKIVFPISCAVLYGHSPYPNVAVLIAYNGGREVNAVLELTTRGAAVMK